MPSLREALNQRPWLGWTVALVCMVVAGVLLITRLTGSGPPDSVERRSQTVTIRCTETGEEWQMNRGEFERLLLTMPGQIDAAKGIPRPSDGKLTGVLVDKDEWDETVQRINQQKQAFGGRRGG